MKDPENKNATRKSENAIATMKHRKQIWLTWDRDREKKLVAENRGNVNVEMKKVEEGEEDRTGNRDKKKFEYER
ncbi:hypothetical protein Csa_004368 [Cucumis sativus]|uniref:Uncharacterized protein n=1 Tax=Cucumis sativus TaxID=3659 RepID=A0A0A0KHM2_CUCSA|nr:hypothetical protein Csa_004368 [Cucumis sativus]